LLTIKFSVLPNKSLSSSHNLSYISQEKDGTHGMALNPEACHEHYIDTRSAWRLGAKKDRPNF
jgi:hypothetical protein